MLSHTGISPTASTPHNAELASRPQASRSTSVIRTPKKACTQIRIIPETIPPMTPEIIGEVLPLLIFSAITAAKPPAETAASIDNGLYARAASGKQANRAAYTAIIAVHAYAQCLPTSNAARIIPRNAAVKAYPTQVANALSTVETRRRITVINSCLRFFVIRFLSANKSKPNPAVVASEATPQINAHITYPPWGIPAFAPASARRR